MASREAINPDASLRAYDVWNVGATCEGLMGEAVRCNADRRDPHRLTLCNTRACQSASPRRIVRAREPRMTGACLATAVAFMFVGNAMAAESSERGRRSRPGQVRRRKLLQGPECVQGRLQSSCKGQNACKGKGFVMSSSEKDCQAPVAKSRSTRPPALISARALAPAGARVIFNLRSPVRIMFVEYPRKFLESVLA